jgi:hypothetical protein
MENILTIPTDRRQSHPLRLVVMMGLTLLLYMMISRHLGSAADGLYGIGG